LASPRRYDLLSDASHHSRDKIICHPFFSIRACRSIAFQLKDKRASRVHVRAGGESNNRPARPVEKSKSLHLNSVFAYTENTVSGTKFLPHIIEIEVVREDSASSLRLIEDGTPLRFVTQ
jgi:hypothetical protein